MAVLRCCAYGLDPDAPSRGATNRTPNARTLCSRVGMVCLFVVYGLFARCVWSVCLLCMVCCLFVGARRVCLLDAVGAVYRGGLSSGVFSVSKGIVMEAFECGSW